MIKKVIMNFWGFSIYRIQSHNSERLRVLAEVLHALGHCCLDWPEDSFELMDKILDEDLMLEEKNDFHVFYKGVKLEKKGLLIKIKNPGINGNRTAAFYIEEKRLKKLLKDWQNLTATNTPKIIITWNDRQVLINEYKRKRFF